MRNFSKLALIALVASACTSQNGSKLTGEITGLTNDTVLVFANDPVAGQTVEIDTVPVVDNKFAVTLPDSSVLLLYIIEKPAGNGAMRMATNPPFVFMPGDEMKVTGDITDLKASGTEIYDNLAKAVNVTAVEEKIKAVGEKLTEAYKNNEEKVIDSLSNIVQGLYEDLSREKLEFIKNNPNSLVSGYLYQGMKSIDGLEAEKILGDNVKNSALGGFISKITENYNHQAAIDKASENIKSGKMAPDFKLKNLNNEEMSLASFKGKYVLLDFWGTWCGWCIKGIPDMKKYYAKYKDRMEIVGICCGDTEEKWRNGVKKHELPWTNLFNDKDNDITTIYAISGYPTKILVDPNGKIVDVFVGESEDLYNRLDELFK